MTLRRLTRRLVSDLCESMDARPHEWKATACGCLEHEKAGIRVGHFGGVFVGTARMRVPLFQRWRLHRHRWRLLVERALAGRV